MWSDPWRHLTGTSEEETSIHEATTTKLADTDFSLTDKSITEESKASPVDDDGDGEDKG